MQNKVLTGHLSLSPISLLHFLLISILRKKESGEVYLLSKLGRRWAANSDSLNGTLGTFFILEVEK
jgi:hypothetical protein